MLTLLTWPPFRGGSWEPSGAPAWWQFEWLAGLGFALSVLPSIAVASLHDSFVSAEYLRYLFVGGLVGLEVLLLCWLTYRVIACFSRNHAKNRTEPAGPP